MSAKVSPTQLGKYDLFEELGSGGYGTVYRARDIVLEVERAVKLMHPALVADRQFIERFTREARYAARLKHPHIVPVYDLGESEGHFFLAMEYLPGGSLKDLVTRQGRLPFGRAVEILGQVAGALDYIHAQGLVHRDIKPGNILFNETGQASVSDLGFAKALSGSSSSLSTSGGMIGTPSYMAPEVWRGKEVTPATDVYSLACVFYEMVTGQVLFEGDSPPEVMTKHMLDGPQFPQQWPKGVPAWIEGVLVKAFAMKPEERYQSMGEFSSALERFVYISGSDLQPKIATLSSGLNEKANSTLSIQKPLKEKAAADQVNSPFAQPVKISMKASQQEEPQLVPVQEAGPVANLSRNNSLSRERDEKPKRKFPVWAIVVIVLVIIIAIWHPFLGQAVPSTSVPPTEVPKIVVPVIATLAPTAPVMSAPVAAGPVTLNVWDCYLPFGAEEAAINGLVKQYMSTHPNVKINLVEVPYDQCFSKYETDTTAGGGPDMFTAPNDNLGSEVRANIIAPIDNLLQGKLTGYTQAGIAGVTVNGKIYAVPGFAKAVGLFYNKSTIATPPVTTEDLMNLVKSGKKLGFINNGAYYIWGFWSGFGGTLMDANNKCIADQTTGFADALRYLAGLQKAGAAIFTDEGKADTAFEQGQLDMIFDGPWVLGNFEKAVGSNLGVTAGPTGPNGIFMPMMGVDGWYINPNSQNPAAATDAALYFFGKDGLTAFENTAGDPAARLDVIPTDPLVKAFADIASGSFPRPQSAEFGNYWGPFGDAMTAVFSGQATATTAVATACSIMNAANKK